MNDIKIDKTKIWRGFKSKNAFLSQVARDLKCRQRCAMCDTNWRKLDTVSVSIAVNQVDNKTVYLCDDCTTKIISSE